MRMMFGEYGIMIVEAIMGFLVLTCMIEVIFGNTSLCGIIKNVINGLG